MSKKEIVFTIGLTVLMGVLWIMGEVVMGLWIAVSRGGHIAWAVGTVVVTVVINTWHSMKIDESDRQNPKRQKYERKMKKREK